MPAARERQRSSKAPRRLITPAAFEPKPLPFDHGNPVAAAQQPYRTDRLRSSFLWEIFGRDLRRRLRTRNGRLTLNPHGGRTSAVKDAIAEAIVLQGEAANDAARRALQAPCRLAGDRQHPLLGHLARGSGDDLARRRHDRRGERLVRLSVPDRRGGQHRLQRRRRPADRQSAARERRLVLHQQHLVRAEPGAAGHPGDPCDAARASLRPAADGDAGEREQRRRDLVHDRRQRALGPVGQRADSDGRALSGAVHRRGDDDGHWPSASTLRARSGRPARSSTPSIRMPTCSDRRWRRATATAPTSSRSRSCSR